LGNPRAQCGQLIGGRLEPRHQHAPVLQDRRAARLKLDKRGALVDLSDDVATRVQSLFYLDAADALRKALNES